MCKLQYLLSAKIQWLSCAMEIFIQPPHLSRSEDVIEWVSMRLIRFVFIQWYARALIINKRRYFMRYNGSGSHNGPVKCKHVFKIFMTYASTCSSLYHKLPVARSFIFGKNRDLCFIVHRNGALWELEWLVVVDKSVLYHDTWTFMGYRDTSGMLLGNMRLFILV